MYNTVQHTHTCICIHIHVHVHVHVDCTCMHLNQIYMYTCTFTVHRAHAQHPFSLTLLMSPLMDFFKASQASRW